jgi:phosphatidate cytidylyltransferase
VFASDAFRFFGILTAGLLAAGGATIAVARFGFARDVSRAWEAYRGWLVMVPILVATFLAGSAVAVSFFTIAAVAAFIEYSRATGLHRDLAMTSISVAGITATGIVTIAGRYSPQGPGNSHLIMFMAMPVFAGAALMFAAIVRNRPEGQLKAVALAFFGVLSIGWSLGHAGLLASLNNGYGYLIYLVFAVELNDVAAFTAGKLFGRRPLCSKISPSKTWEGALAAALISGMFPLVVRFALPDFSVYECVAAGLIVGVGGQLGDLSISVIKRDIGIKDMGSLIRGHGGVLDRVDSLLFAAPLFFHFTRYVQGA